MAVAFDAASVSGDLSNLTSGSWNHTCSGVDRALYVILCGYDAESNLSGVTVTYNGVAMTKLGGNQDTDNNNTVIWELVAPAAGTHAIQVSNIPASYIQCGGGAISYVGVDQVNPTPGAVVNGPNLATVDVSSLSAGDIALIAFYDGDNDNPNPAVGSKRFSEVLNSSSRAIGADRDGTGTVTCSFTGVADPMISAVRVKASSSGPFGGTLQAQSSTIAGAITTTVRATSTMAAQAAVLAGRVNSLRVSGTLAAQAAHVSGVFIPAGLFNGQLLVDRSQIAGAISVTVNFTGALNSQSSAVVGAYEPEYIHLNSSMASQLATMSGFIDIIQQRPPRQTEVRSVRKGYKRPFNIYIDEL